MTTAQLADQFASLMQSIPAIQSQLETLKGQQNQLQMSLQGSQVPRPPPYRKPFPQAPNPEGGSAGIQTFGDLVGTPPRTKLPNKVGLSPAAQALPEDEPIFVPSEEGFLKSLAPPVQTDVPNALLQQSQAISALVAHLIGQDSLTDLASSGGSSSLSTKGTAKREKLQSDLANRSGNFLLQVAQNAHRRLKPTEPVPKDFPSFNGKSILSKYLERQGGFQGQKDLGLVAWLLAQIGDLMIAGDQKGASEMLALALVTVEQCAQDQGRWELAWILSLQEDPPTGIFTQRTSSTNPRVRAFAPLCPAPWATTALSYIKELDVITNRRLEAIPSKKVTPEKSEDAEGRKKKPRFPKRPKQAEPGASS